MGRITVHDTQIETYQVLALTEISFRKDYEQGIDIIPLDECVLPLERAALPSVQI